MEKIFGHKYGLNNSKMDSFLHYIGLHRCSFLQFAQCLMEATLRLPGLFIFELMIGYHQQISFGINDTNLHTVVNNKLNHQLNFNDKWTRYLEFNQFIKSRNMDVVLENVLIGSALGATFLLLPVQKLVSVYLHTVSVLLLGAGYYLSFRYVQSEQQARNSPTTSVILDDFAKLERHGFHLLSQVMLAASVSCLLSLKSPWMRAILTVGAAPIVARLCGLPADKLHLVHNFACCFLMINICFYFLNSVPNIVCLMKRAESRISRSILASNRRRNINNQQQQLDDPLEILATIWHWFDFPPLFALFFSVLFITEYYVQYNEVLKNEPGSANFLLNYDMILHSLVNSCSTPLSVLGFCAATFYFSYFLLLSVKNFLNDSSQNLQNFDPELIGPAITESAVVFILAMKIGLATPDKDWRHKSTLICILLFVIISSLLSSIYDIIEPILSKLSITPFTKFKKHIKTLTLCSLFTVLPAFMSYKMTYLLDGKMDVWLTIIISSCLLVTVQTFGALTNYFLFIYDAHCRRSNEIWPMMDDFMFYCKCTVSTLELIVALGVISAFGLHHKSENCWSMFSVVIHEEKSGISNCHCYANIWIPLKNGWKIFLTRKHAAEEIGTFPSATEDQLNDLQDVCAICYQELSEAKITPCRHYFHAYCLKKWLYVQQSCPMCQTTLNAQSGAAFKISQPPSNVLNVENSSVVGEEGEETSSTTSTFYYGSSSDRMNDSETSVEDVSDDLADDISDSHRRGESFD
uniref:RING-type domain-containing protein n=1 Tax=Romanomermis culicivorax TaxID=13658 RepID=A0A915JA46_ROMCU